MIGKVWKISANHYFVHAEGKVYDCQISGRLKKDRIAALKLVTVGDDVELEPRPKGEGHIINIRPRWSKLSRHDVLNPAKEQVIVANIHHLVIVQSAADPPLNPEHIDRCLIMAHVGNLKPWLCINKIDLATPPEELLRPYRDIRKFFVSAATGQGVRELKEALQGWSSAFLGPSGVGKSSLLNAMDPNLNLKVGEVSVRTGEGRHTTSWCELLQIGDAVIADTPGLESFTLWGIGETSLRLQFEEFQENACRFPNCVHVNEPDCGIKNAVAAGEISELRYYSYLRILEDIRSRPKIYRREGRRRAKSEE